jgi:hypothetical protein
MSAATVLREKMGTTMKPGDLWDWIKLVALVGGMLLGYYQLVGKVSELQRQTTRIERYLSSKDTNYWQAARSLDEP